MAQRILSWLLALVFVAAGVPKLLGAAAVVEGFQRMGYPSWFRLLIGVLEVGGGVALVIPAVAPIGTGVLIIIMMGAVWTVLRVGESVAPPLIVGALLVVLAALRLRRPPAT